MTNSSHSTATASAPGWDDLPAVMFDKDICVLLDISPRTLKRRHTNKTFPIPTLPAIDRKRRYGRGDVIAYLERRQPARGRK
jgi:hypothetical protein